MVPRQDHNFHSFFKISKSKFKNIKKKIEKIHIDAEKSINSVGMKERIGYLIIYWTIFFTNYLIIFLHYIYAK